jgi:hypothetical protein
MMMFIPVLLRRIDIRLAVGAGLLIMGISTILDSNFTMESTGGGFTVSQLMRGVGALQTSAEFGRQSRAGGHLNRAGSAAHRSCASAGRMRHCKLVTV